MLLFAVPFFHALFACRGSADETRGDYIIAKEQKERCDRRNQQEVNACMADEAGKVDRQMKNVYSKLIDVLKYPQGIEESQRAWEKYRDAQCSAEIMQIPLNSSIYPLALTACQIELTEDRIRILRRELAQDCNGCPPRK